MRGTEERLGMVLAAEISDLDSDPQRHAMFLLLLCETLPVTVELDWPGV